MPLPSGWRASCCRSSASNHFEREKNDKSAEVLEMCFTPEKSLDEIAGMEANETTPIAFQANRLTRPYKQIVVYGDKFFIPVHYTLDERPVYLGGGSYGSVIKAYMENRRCKIVEVAIKKYHNPFAGGNAQRVFREIRLLQQMRHDNVIRALDIYTPDKREKFNNVFVVTEYAGDTLHDLLQYKTNNNWDVLNFDDAQSVIYQILKGLKYMHSASITHRDLKPSNIAIAKDWELSILDFGLARKVEKGNTGLSENVMTRWYRSPEVIHWDIGKYDKQVDMWSVGCIAGELLIGRPLFPGENENDQYQRIIDLCGGPDSALLAKIETKNGRNNRNVIEKLSGRRQRRNFSEYFKNFDGNIPDDAIDFLDKVLVLDPEVRLTVEQALNHEYMRPYHDESKEPVESRAFTLDDILDPSTDFKSLVWDDIQAFTGDEESPPFD